MVLEFETHTTKKGADFGINGEGSIYVLTPLSDAGKEWVDEHIPEDAQRWGNGIVVEHRYLNDVIDGITREGLTAI